jgi:hypothetical protein
MEPVKPLPDMDRRTILVSAFLMVLPMYALLAAVVHHAGEGWPRVSERFEFAGFAVAAAAGLAGILGSFPLRRRVARRPADRAFRGDTAGLLAGLAAAELAIFLGLIYFILFRDSLGLGLLAVATLGAFAAHARDAGPD